MFALLRRLVLVILVASTSIVFWETSGIRFSLAPNPPPPAPDQEKRPSVSSHPAEAQNESTLQPWTAIPGTPGQRFLAWALFVLLLPMVAATVTNRVLQQESNTAILVLLFGYTGLDVLAAWLVGGIQIGSIWSGVAYLIALLAVFAYNLWVCSLLARFQQ